MSWLWALLLGLGGLALALAALPGALSGWIDRPLRAELASRGIHAVHIGEIRVGLGAVDLPRGRELRERCASRSSLAAPPSNDLSMRMAASRLLRGAGAFRVRTETHGRAVVLPLLVDYPLSRIHGVGARSTRVWGCSGPCLAE